jgi:hypothetical protein
MIQTAFAFGFIASNWAALAAYMGVTSFLAIQRPRPWIFLFTPLIILGATGAFLINQQAFDELYRYCIYLTDGRPFWTANFLLNTCFAAGIGLSLVNSCRLPPRPGGFVRFVCCIALICAVPWIMLDGRGDGLFFARLYMRNDDFVLSRLIFVPLFAGVATAAFLWLKTLYRINASIGHS